uniref:ATP synthase subunit a n=1 Tax=Odontobutis sinensis TaxID=357168 RepID=A0A8F9S077_9GOBI|nr:ATP synthase F0 subunit 6 [Odontobutis sinensis]QYK91627.1 ATP synthase F0 subunit 6 [Odontobutis sinensis]
MMTNLFDQFMSPTFMGIPLIAIATIIPWLLWPATTTRWLDNRLLTLQSWFISQFTYNLFSPMKLKGHKWAMTLTSLMLFLISLNMLGLIPYTFTPTTQLSVNLGLAVPLWLATVLTGLRNQPTAALGHLLPEGTPMPLIPILIIIETISLLIRPLALGVRLTANLTAGHLLIQLTAMATLVLLPLLPAAAALTIIMMYLLTVLEIAVAMIQAYVFVLLLSLYLQENI